MLRFNMQLKISLV